MNKINTDFWLDSEWVETTEGYELWLSARKFNIQEAYDLLKKQHGVRNMPLGFIQLGWIKYGWEDDDLDHEFEQMYWRNDYRRGSYPIWYIDADIEQYKVKR